MSDTAKLLDRVVKLSAPVSQDEAKSVIAFGFKSGLLSLKEPPPSAIAAPALTKLRPSPKLPDDLRKCVECDRYIRTRMVNGKRIYIFHNVSEVPHARACGMAGQELIIATCNSHL